MAITLRTPGLLRVTTATASHVVPTPTSFAAGDLLILISNIDSKSTTVTTPAGWTLMDDVQTSVALGNRVRVFTKIATGSEGASVTLTLNSGKLGSAIMYGVVGADQAAPITIHPTQDNPTSSTSHVAPSVTPAADGCLVISWFAGFFNGSYTPPGAMSEDADQANADTTMETASVALGSSTSGVATGTYAATASSSVASIAGTIVVNPSGTSQWTFRDSQKGTGTAAAVVTKPTGTADGDMLIATANTTSGTIGAPAGWTLIDSLYTASRSTGAWWKIAASEGASYTFTGASSTNAVIAAFTPAAGLSAVFDVGLGSANATSTTTSVAPSITTTANHDLLVFAGMGANGGTTWTPPADYTLPTNGSQSGTGLMYKLDGGLAGATGTVTATRSITAGSVSFNIAVKASSSVNATVNATVLTGTGAALVPTPKTALDAPILTGSGAALVPALRVALTAPVLAGTGLLPAPSLLVSGAVAAPVLSGAGAMLVPAVIIAITVAPPVLAGSGALVAPALVASTNPAATALTGSGAMLVPSVSAGLQIAATVLTGSGAALAPAPKLALSATVLAGSGLMPAPALAITLNAAVLTGSGAMLAPSPSVGSSVAASLLTGSGALLAPSPALALAAPVLAGSGSALAPSIVSGTFLAVPVLTGSGLLPVVQIVALIPTPDAATLLDRAPFAVFTGERSDSGVAADREPFAVHADRSLFGAAANREPAAIVVDRAPGATVA